LSLTVSKGLKPTFNQNIGFKVLKSFQYTLRVIKMIIDL